MSGGAKKTITLRQANNTTVLRRFYSGGHVDVANGGTRYAYTTDHLGSIREVMQLDGTSGNPTTATLAARYDYDLWGKRTVIDGGSTAETLVMHGYTGHIRHPWSGLWLAPYRAYNSGLGRWISRDPIAENGGINLYAYVGNEVMVAVDTLGLRASDIIEGVWSYFRGNYRNLRHAARTLGLLGNTEMQQAASENAMANAARDRYFNDPGFRDLANQGTWYRIEDIGRNHKLFFLGRAAAGFAIGKLGGRLAPTKGGGMLGLAGSAGALNGDIRAALEGLLDHLRDLGLSEDCIAGLNISPELAAALAGAGIFGSNPNYSDLLPLLFPELKK